MKPRSPRASRSKPRRERRIEPVSDVFEQPERSLLGEALSRPLGIAAALTIIGSAGTFAANHFHFQYHRVDGFALVGLFFGGGLLLSMLLRSGDTSAPSRKFGAALRPMEDGLRPIDDDVELTLDDAVEEDEEEELLVHHLHQRPGLAEGPRAAPPVPPAALVEPNAVKAAPDVVDDEVANFQQALVHYANAGDYHGQGEVLRRLGHLAKGRGHLKESREFYMNSRACFRKIDDHYAEAAVLLDLGQVLESLDEHDAASAAYRDANRALLDVAMNNSSDRYNAVQAHAAD